MKKNNDLGPKNIGETAFLVLFAFMLVGYIIFVILQELEG